MIPSTIALLSPFWISWKNDFARSGKKSAQRLFIFAAAAAVWFGTYWVTRRVLIYFQSVYDLGPALAYQLLLIVLVTFFSMLLFSNVITSLSTFFLARDLDLVMSTPVPTEAFYYSRFIATAINSSWMVLFFTLPVFAAYGWVFAGGMIFYLWLLLILPLFLTIPAAIGIVVTHLLVYFLPARRIRDILLFIGLFGFIVLFFLFRFSQPERLVQPESFGHFVEFLTAMETPSSLLLPSTWAGEILAATLFNRPVERGFFYALLASYALFLPLAGYWICRAVYLSGWSKAQESRQGRRTLGWVDCALEWLTLPFPHLTRALMIKDIKTFLRDSTQWSQLFLLVALVVVYLYNFKVLPLDRSPIPTATLKTAVAFANLALAGFVLSAVAVRFAFPAVSLEGRAYWILQTAPMSVCSLLWSKFWLNFLPLLVLGGALIVVSNYLLQVPGWMMALSLATTLLMTLGITAIGVGIGALYPKFHFDNAAEIPTSFGGAACMIFSIGFIGMIVMIEAWPIYQLALEGLKSGAITAPPFRRLAPSLFAVVAITIIALVLPMKLGLKHLEQMKD